MRDGVSGMFVVSVGQGGLRRLTAYLTVISVWKTVVSETFWSGESGLKVGGKGEQNVQSKGGRKRCMSRTVNSLSNRHQLDPLSGRS